MFDLIFKKGQINKFSAFKFIKSTISCKKLSYIPYEEWELSHKNKRFRPVLNANINSYDELYNTFKWNIPDKFNIGYECSDRHVNNGFGDYIALYDDNTNKSYTFNDISNYSNKLCNSLKELGVKKGDRIGILLQQSFETGISHLSSFKLGCINIPLFTLFGLDALAFRLNDSSSKLLITNLETYENKILEIKNELKYLEKIIIVDINEHDTKNNIYSLHKLLQHNNYYFNYEKTTPDDPSLIIYTSGTTGPPKGALHGHKVLLGHLPGIELPHNFYPKTNDVFWTPADWAWIGGLLDALLPSWYQCLPIVACRMKKFDVIEAFDIMKRYKVSNTFFPPTVLKLIKSHLLSENDNNNLCYKLRSLGCGGETLGESLLEWGKTVFDVEINEFYGQTECNLIVSNCSKLFDIKNGSMGKCVPGHKLKVINVSTKKECKANEIGVISVLKNDPVMFLNYWNNDKKTSDKFIKCLDDNLEYMLTGDLGSIDDNGYYRFSSRDDDIITFRGYRIGPGPIEMAIMRLKEVANVGVIGKPDIENTEIIKAFIVLNNEFKYLLNDKQKIDNLKNEIVNTVKKYCALHEYPREIQFIDIQELPMTITGKIQRGVLKQKEIEKLKQTTQKN